MSRTRPASAILPVVMGLIFICIGGYIMLAGLGITSVGKLLVPPWVIVCIGLVFSLFGVALFMAAAPQANTAAGPQGYLTILPEERPTRLIYSWVFTVVWNLFIGVFWYLLLFGPEGEGSIWVAYVVLGIFTPIGLVLLYTSVKTTLSAARFGYVPLHLLADNARAGATLTGQILIPRHSILKTVAVRPICYQVDFTRVRNTKGGSSINKSMTEHWSGMRKDFPVGPDGSAAIQYRIPADLPGDSGIQQPDFHFALDTVYYCWMLEVTADVPGVDLQRTYALPVQDALPGPRDVDLPVADPDTENLTAEQVARKTSDVITTALAELSSGASMDVIGDKLAGMGIAPAIISAVMQQIAGDMASPYRESAQVWLAHQSRMQAEINAGKLLLLDRPAVPRPRHTRDKQDKVSTAGSKRLFSQPALSGKTVFIVNVIIFLLIGVYLYAQYQQGNKRIQEAEQLNARSRAEALEKKAAMQQRFSGYQIVPSPDTPYVYVAGRGITAGHSGNDLLIKLDEIRLEKKKNRDRATFISLGISVYQTAGTDLGASWDQQIRGVLTDASPVMTLNDQVFVIRNAGPSCVSGSCMARLLLTVQTGLNITYAENTEFSQFSVDPTSVINMPAPSPSKYWDTYYGEAVSAKQKGDLQQADRLFQETMDFIVQNLGPDHAAAARTLVTWAHLYQLQKKPADYEQAMLKAYAILDRYTDAEIQTALGSSFYAVDKELVARRLGDFYWDAFRYADSFKYYELAYQAAPGLQTTDYSRNLKLAFSSAGVMKTACMLGKWELADKAMAELKLRYKSVEPETRKQLDYWINTGEPRLKNRKC